MTSLSRKSLQHVLSKSLSANVKAYSHLLPRICSIMTAYKAQCASDGTINHLRVHTCIKLLDWAIPPLLYSE